MIARSLDTHSACCCNSKHSKTYSQLRSIVDVHSLIYDWNHVESQVQPPHPVMFDDESLRDGLQSPSVFDPPMEQKIEILHLMESIGIETADVGLPGAGPRAQADVLALCREIVDQRLKIRPNCAARTHVNDVIPILEISNKAGLPIEVCTFIGSSPIRFYAEDWDLDRMLRLSEEAVTLAVKEGLPVMFVTEDTTRAHPETIQALYSTAIRAGATRICVCDTVGHATPSGVGALIRFVREIVKETGAEVGVDWHGHSDRGLGVMNSIAAYEAGATRIHGTGLGIGERVGNTPMDQLLVNLKLMGYIDRDLTNLGEYCRLISKACRVPIPANYPVVGRDAFRTATGVHAAAVIKALKKQDLDLANLVYSGVPASMVGREQEIEIGPMSGKSNVVYWLEKRGIEATEDRVEKVYQRAKRSSSVLETDEILKLVAS